MTTSASNILFILLFAAILSINVYEHINTDEMLLH